MFALLIVCNLGYTQNKIIGKITSNGLALEGATISMPSLHIETISTTNGEYVLTHIPKGKHQLVVSYIGYETAQKEVNINSFETKVDVEMTEKPHQIDEIIIVTAFNKLQSQNVMKVEHQNLKSMRQKGVTTLIEGLATIPGVSQIATGTSIGKPVIRGLSGNRVLVYNQGVRLENQQFGEEHGLGLNDAGVESVEVIKGPASLLYGSDALGGVLYFNPEKFALPNSYNLNFSSTYFSNTLGNNTSFGYKLSDEKLKFIARISKNSHADYKIPNKNRITNTRFNELDFKGGLNYTATHFSTTFRYNFNKLDLGIPENGIAEQTTIKKPDFPKQKVIGQTISLNSVIFLKKSKFELDLGYINNNRNEFEDSDIPVLNMLLKTFNYNLKYYLPKTKNIETIFGIQGMAQDNTNFGEELLIPNANTRDFGFFTTSNIEWNKNTFQTGIRFDTRKISSETNGEIGEERYFEAIDKSFNSFNASLGYKTTFRDKLIFRLNLASGFRAPNLAELTSNGVHEGSNRYEIGNNDLKNEQNFQTDLNIEYRNPHFEWFANGFYNSINKYIYIQPTGDIIGDNVVYKYVQNNAALYGGETGIHFHPHPIDWLHITASFETVFGKQNKQNLPLIPTKKLSGILKIDFKDYKNFKESFVSAGTDYFFKQNNIETFETKTLDYALLNIGAGTKIWLNKAAFTVYFNANNLLNKTYISHLSRLKTDDIPNMGRNIVFGVDFKI
jgi:iron complex outermembrane receptor protein